MSKKIEQSSKNIQRLLTEQMISQAELARRINTKPVVVNRWVKGKMGVGEVSAYAIHEQFPEYSEAFLLGFTPFKNEEEAAAKKAHVDKQVELATRERIIINFQQVESLARINRIYPRLVFGDAVIAFDKGSREEAERYWKKVDEFFDSDRNGLYVDLQRFGQTVRITKKQWLAFQEEIQNYVGMRLLSVMRRGEW